MFLPIAYIGPGGGLAAIAAFLVLALAVILAVAGFLWFPIKRLLSKKEKTDSDSDTETKP